MAREYVDFEVEIDEGHDRVVVRSLITGRDTIEFPYDEQELDQRRKAVETALSVPLPGSKAGGESPANKWLKEAIDEARAEHDFALWAYVFMMHHS